MECRKETKVEVDRGCVFLPSPSNGLHESGPDECGDLECPTSPAKVDEEHEEDGKSSEGRVTGRALGQALGPWDYFRLCVPSEMSEPV